MLDEKTEKLLELIVDLYIQRGEPIGSKILYKMNALNMAPSTLRKYMNMLESLDYVFQPYVGA
jgi:heat-inducible transcriptional repressor